MNLILVIVVAILATVGIVWLINKFIPQKLKPVVMLVLWGLIALFAYQTFNSVYKPIQFNQVKKKRYAEVIKNLKDIRSAQLAHRQVTGQFAGNFDDLVKFIDTAEFTITQRRDSSIVDAELTKRYGGVTTYKEITVIDTLGFASVKDSLFKGSDRYKTMMNLPVGKEGAKFELKAGLFEEIPVFEVSVDKSVILDGQDKDLITIEKQVVAVDGVNGPNLKVGSMEEVNTNGNWPKTYGENDN
jgi:hypothetical protein